MTLLWSVTTPLCDSCFRALYKSCFICWFQFLILARRSNRQFHLLILPSYNVQGVPQENCPKSLKQNILGQRKYSQNVLWLHLFQYNITLLYPICYLLRDSGFSLSISTLFRGLNNEQKGLVLWVTTYVCIFILHWNFVHLLTAFLNLTLRWCWWCHILFAY